MFVLRKKVGRTKKGAEVQSATKRKPPANQIFRDILASQGHTNIMLSKLAPPLIHRFTAGKFKLVLRALRVKHVCKNYAKDVLRRR